MVRNHLFLLVSLQFFQTAASQNFVFNPHKFGANLFAGGIDNPRFQFVDIDGDSDNDLFMIDRDEKLWFYRNVNGSFSLEPGSAFGLTVGTWLQFADIDGDGDKDCLTNLNFSDVSMFTNTGTPVNPQFQLTHEALVDTSGTQLFSESLSIPAFADIDADGDLDFFTGGSIGSITFYKNIGTPSVPQFTFITSEFGGINIQGGGTALSKALHGASGIEFFDVDSNGVLDLFWGDYFNQSLYFLRNNGTKQNANISLVDSTYPNEDVVSSIGFNLPQHVDVDADGRIDLMIGSVFPTGEIDNFMFYKNTGTNAQPYYSLQTKNFIPMIDVGSRSCVTGADYDNDGDIDLCLSSALGSLFFFVNKGTQSQPEFVHLPASSLHIDLNFYATVTGTDLNGDSKVDLIVGSFYGKLRTFINTTTNGVISFAEQSHPLNAFNVGQNSAPYAADIDADGALDVLVGNSGGQMWLLKNTGTNSAPAYTSELFFNSIDVGNDAIPFVSDIDSDGILDILIGNSEGKIHHYKRSPASALTFDLVTKDFQNINLRTQTAPFVVDIDADGDKDLLSGNGKGGVSLYENTTLMNVEAERPLIPKEIVLYQNYPNPFNPSTKISFSITEDSYVSLRIFDLLGREVETLIEGDMSSGEHSVRWNATNVHSGTYFYRLVVKNNFHQNSIAKSMAVIK